MKRSIKKHVIEFLVIFISITLSFVVEEWRTNKQERNVARQFLQRLRSELTEKTLHTQLYLDYNREAIINFQRISINFKTREIKDDSLFQYIIYSEGSGVFEPELATWESLKSSGAFASIKPEIIDSVNSLLQSYKHLQGSSKYLSDLFIQTWPMFLPDIPPHEVTDQWISFFQTYNLPLSIKPSDRDERADMSKFLSNSIAVDYFFTKTLFTISIENNFKSLPEKEKRLIALLEKEIEE